MYILIQNLVGRLLYTLVRAAHCHTTEEEDGAANAAEADEERDQDENEEERGEGCSQVAGCLEETEGRQPTSV